MGIPNTHRSPGIYGSHQILHLHVLFIFSGIVIEPVD